MGYKLRHCTKYEIEYGDEIGYSNEQEYILDLLFKIEDLYDLNIILYYDSSALEVLEIDKNNFIKFYNNINKEDFDENELRIIDEFKHCIDKDNSNLDNIIRFESF